MEQTLGLDDLRFMKAMIEKLTQRGGFYANEMTDVGRLYNKLTTFLAAAEASIANQTAEAAVVEG